MHMPTLRVRQPDAEASSTQKARSSGDTPTCPETEQSGTSMTCRNGSNRARLPDTDRKGSYHQPPLILTRCVVPLAAGYQRKRSALSGLRHPFVDPLHSLTPRGYTRIL